MLGTITFANIPCLLAFMRIPCVFMLHTFSKHDQYKLKPKNVE
jgi:hypothetical protein